MDPDNNIPTVEEIKLKFEKSKFRIELIKWFIGSVALVIMTVIIDKGFKERSAGIQEMQVYDKYVEIILKADNIEDRWKLSQYFSIVTPTKRLRDRWIAYKDTINPDYMEFKILKEKQNELTNSGVVDSLSKTSQELIKVQNQLEPFEKKLNNTGANEENLNWAQKWEKQGFTYLLNKDVDNAIEAFQLSEYMYNGYHQVYEIANYLKKNKLELGDRNSQLWETAFKVIVNEFGWGMPSDVRTQLSQISN